MSDSIEALMYSRVKFALCIVCLKLLQFKEQLHLYLHMGVFG